MSDVVPESPHMKDVGVPMPKLADDFYSCEGTPPSNSTAGVTDGVARR